MLLVTAIAAVLVGGLAGMLQRPGAGRLPSYVFVLLVAAVPVGMVILFSVVHSVIDFWRRRR